MKPDRPSRFEVMKHIEKDIEHALTSYLKPIEQIWQPSDFLPDARSEGFFEEVQRLQERTRGLNSDLLAVLVGNTITEEALPNYEAWLINLNGVTEDWDTG